MKLLLSSKALLEVHNVRVVDHLQKFDLALTDLLDGFVSITLLELLDRYYVRD
jgi:hypothetical protein